MATGGYQPPAQPAAVSGPGRLSQRTDGGPGQPIRVAPGGEYGSRQALVSQQQAAPLAAASEGRGGTAGPGRPAVPSQLTEGIFGPTRRPDEPVTAGIPMGAGTDGTNLLPTDPVEFARAVFHLAPSPDLQRLLRAYDREL